MLVLSASRARGAHPYLTTPQHTAYARSILGEEPMLLPEQGVILCDTYEDARRIGTDTLRAYLSMPNYAKNMLRIGFSEEDVTQVSDRLFDALIAWGDEGAVMRRVAEHQAAGADHVCVQVLTEHPRAFPREQWRRIAAAL
jgi:probable F420-dependent oxidoreductase